MWWGWEGDGWDGGEVGRLVRGRDGVGSVVWGSGGLGRVVRGIGVSKIYESHPQKIKENKPAIQGNVGDYYLLLFFLF